MKSQVSSLLTPELIVQKKKDKIKIEKNLLFDDMSPSKKEEPETDEEKKLFPHLRSKVFVYFIHDTNPYSAKEMNPFMS